MTQPADASRLAIHTVTTRPWSLPDACAAYAAAGVRGITVWREHLVDGDAERSAAVIRDAGLAVPAYCRGGFFPAPTADKRRAALDENRRVVDEAAVLGADMVVLVCGAVPGLPLAAARGMIRDGIGALLDHAGERDVKLAIEPLHPMYAADRSAINTLAQARAVWEEFAVPGLGVAVDVYHTWWDPDLDDEIARAGAAGALFGFHVCDWRVETRDLLNDRGLMGEGCIDIAGIRAAVEAAGFAGFNEVEIFSHWHWRRDQGEFLRDIVGAYRQHC